jgi:hypothetical protein
MRAFIIGSVIIILLAVVGGFGLHFVQEPSSIAYSSPTGAKLDHAEAAVNNYGWQVVPD